MGKLKVIIVFLFSAYVLTLTTFAQTSYWIKTNGAETGSINSFAIGNNGDVYAATNAGILKSADQGYDWTPCSKNLSSPLTVAVDSAGRLFAGNESGVFRSTDGGQTWSNVLSTTEHFSDGSSMMHAVLSIIVTKGNTIQAGIEGKGIYRTANQGQTWDTTNAGLTNNDIYSLCYSDNGTMYAGTKDGVYRSTDNGASWVHRPPVRDFTYALVSGKDDEVYAGVSYIAGESGVYKSTNAGDTWSKFGLQNVPVVGLAIDSAGVLAACVNGDWNPANEGVYISNTSLGVWSHTIDSLSTLVCRAVFITPGGVLLAGTNGGGIYRLSTPADIFTLLKNENNLPSSFSLMQNYPNPFNPSTTINYSIPKASLVTIKVYDVLGREVTTLINKNETTGDYSVNFNTSGLSSGIYFYQLKAGDYVQTRKMILLK